MLWERAMGEKLMGVDVDVTSHAKE